MIYHLSFDYICTSVALSVDIAAHFLPRNRLIYRKKAEYIGQKFYVNVTAIYGCRQVGLKKHLKKLHCYLKTPLPLLSNNYHNNSLKNSFPEKPVESTNVLVTTKKRVGTHLRKKKKT